MNAIEFTNRLSGIIKTFFAKCCNDLTNDKDIYLSAKEMQKIEYSHDNNGFTLRLEIEDYSYVQEFGIFNGEIVEQNFEIY